MGKKGFLFTPIKRPEWLNTFWNDLVPNISSASQIDSLKKEENFLKYEHDSISLITEWLIDIHTKGTGLISNNSHYNDLMKKFLYYLRSYFYYLSMTYLNGMFVPKGLRRDFFK